ncbi:hypothetical protein D9M69_460280 [compost metagenome]
MAAHPRGHCPVEHGIKGEPENIARRRHLLQSLSTTPLIGPGFGSAADGRTSDTQQTVVSPGAQYVVIGTDFDWMITRAQGVILFFYRSAIRQNRLDQTPVKVITEARFESRLVGLRQATPKSVVGKSRGDSDRTFGVDAFFPVRLTEHVQYRTGFSSAVEPASSSQ